MIIDIPYIILYITVCLWNCNWWFLIYVFHNSLFHSIIYFKLIHIFLTYQFTDYFYSFIYLGTYRIIQIWFLYYGTRNSKPLTPTSTTKIAPSKGFFGFSFALFVNFVFICHLLKFIRNFLTSLLQDSYKVFGTFPIKWINKSLV